MSDFTWTPIYSPEMSNEPRVLSANFGDGYEQRLGDGINTIKDIWNLTFRGTRTEIADILTFLKTKRGVASFTWTPNGEAEVVVKCQKWSRTIVSANLATITATFEQVFE